VCRPQREVEHRLPGVLSEWHEASVVAKARELIPVAPAGIRDAVFAEDRAVKLHRDSPEPPVICLVARDAGYTLQDAPTTVRNRSLEVFPPASDVILRRCLPPPGTTTRVRRKRAWKLSTLRAAGIETDRLCPRTGRVRGLQRCRRRRRVDRSSRI
jgi:hypothetical protein